MLKQIKVLTDEQTKQSLNRLRNDFAEILAPLEKLDSIQTTLSELSDRNDDLGTEIGRKISDLSDNISSIKSKTNEILDMQQDNLSKVNAIHAEISEFKNALNEINWKE
jgi:vacuolar-type H+-ATPase subunit I/STV1